ncbi:hypothetical protein M972_112817 [Acetivibrio thermocellus AD2]|jgi:hypothetical protein|uniref:DUF6985 domain-containing protein n=3 Tax=Acetivibrio TaxID=35829 RepID=A3DH24_ACET2|nr:MULTISPECIES: hypothetical protein [Acetivibrio]CDG36543.1 hypothetical protein CTHBC1_1937 [Acetivibrio thermocellus BC1]ABN53253.1 hypothetical protein Cthe_2046 [Acetivibrio thermocellus ATCC 27405]ALX09713.1 hypothetical protein AD2_02735 [Acetivibrio thermocellus AD2]ANV77488.1 hypothetical protein LQRI_2747 [Acetivibrio thermocellus DSM 2360]EIC03600.1 hypothetical protein YSBL_2731 [Acetivibrio thermocellus YS]
MIPNVHKNSIFWEGNIRLHDWDEYFGRELKIILNIGGDSIVDEVTALHKKGYDFLIAEQARILHTVIEAIFDKYPVWQEEYGYEGKEKEILMPDIDNKNELNQLIYPIKIFIMDVEKDGFPYIGIQFDCKWDQEHGVGVMLYKDNVVDIGGSDTAFMSWIAEEDKNRKKS